MELIKRLFLVKDRNDFYRIGNLFILIVCAIFVLLSFIKHVTPDSAGYLRETLLISDCFKNNVWLGNYAVGLHGILFKLPVALIFLFKPSIVVASIFTIILSLASLLIYNYMLCKILNLEKWNIFILAVFILNYRFLISSITYLREIPLLLTTLLFIYFIINNRSSEETNENDENKNYGYQEKANTLNSNIWVVGITLLLVYEAKEYMFFILYIAYTVWSVYTVFIQDKCSFCSFLRLGDRLTAGVLPTTFVIYLSFFTSILPSNMFTASIIGLAETKYSEVNNLDVVVQAKVYNTILKQSGSTVSNNSEKAVKIGLDSVKEYLSRLISSESFSFESLPLSVFIPSLISSLIACSRWKKEKNYKLLILPITIWVFLVFYMLRLGRARYLFPILPLVAIFYAYFLKEKNTLIVVFTSGAAAFLLISSLLLRNDTAINLIVNFAILVASLVFIFYGKQLTKNIKKIKIYHLIIPFCVVVVSFFIAVMPFINDIKEQYLFGVNYEIDKIIQNTNRNENIWINNIFQKFTLTELIQYYRNDTSIDPEWYAALKTWVPKKKLNIRTTPNTFFFSCVDENLYKNQLEENKVMYVYVIESTYPGIEFQDQECRSIIDKYHWLLLIDKKILRNKVLYTYRVNLYDE